MRDGPWKDRRKNNVRRALTCGMVLGFSLAAPVSLLAQGSPLDAWTQPSVVMSILVAALSIGSARQMVVEDRRRIHALEENMVHKHVHLETVKRIDEKLEHLTTWIGQQGRHL